MDKTPTSSFSILSKSIPDGSEIGRHLIYGRHDPEGENKHPHIALRGLAEDGGTCGVVVVHDSVDSDDWCHGVIIFEGNTKIAEGIERSRLELLGVIQGINDLNRTARGAQHDTTQEQDPNGRGYIGCYPGYDTSAAEQDTHLYHFDGFEVQMSAHELLFAVAQITRRKMNTALLEGTAEDHQKEELLAIAVLTRANVDEAMDGRVAAKSSFTGKYKNPGWQNRRWVGPSEDEPYREKFEDKFARLCRERASADHSVRYELSMYSPQLNICRSNAALTQMVELAVQEIEKARTPTGSMTTITLTIRRVLKRSGLNSRICDEFLGRLKERTGEEIAPPVHLF